MKRPTRQTTTSSDRDNLALPACAVAEKYFDIARNEP